MDPESGLVRFHSMEAMGGAQPGYKWAQGERELQLRVPLPGGTRGRDIEFALTSTTLRVALKAQDRGALVDRGARGGDGHGFGAGGVEEAPLAGEVLIEGTLVAPVLPDDSYFELEQPPPAMAEEEGDEGGAATPVLVVCLAKLTPTRADEHWPCILRGERENDVASFGKPVVAIDENSKEDIRRYLDIMAEAERGQVPLCVRERD